VIYDYTASGVRRSIEDSLQRLGIDSIDIAFVHDISSDNKYLPTPWTEQFEIARKGAFSLIDSHAGRGIDQRLGNRGQHAGADHASCWRLQIPMCACLASQYSLIDHKNALNQVFQQREQRTSPS